METADKAYEAITGIKASDESKTKNKTTEKDVEAQQKLLDLEEKFGQERKRNAIDQEQAIAQARIDGMREGSDKTLAQAGLDFEKEIERIKREQEDLLKQREDNARQLWEAQNSDDKATWSNSGAQMSFFNNGGGELTEKDKAYFEALRKAAKETFERSVLAQYNIERDHRLEYLAQYGDMKEQEFAITMQFQKKINEASGDEGLVDSLKAQLQDALTELHQKFGLAEKGIEGIFDDLEKKSSESIDTAIRAYERLLTSMSDGLLNDSETDELKSLGFSQDFLEQVKRGKVDVDSLKQAIKQLKQAAKDNQTAIKEWGQEWKDIFDGSKSPEERMKSLFAALNKAQQALGMVTDTIADVAGAFGNDKLSSAMDDINNVMDTTMSMAQTGAAIGGPIGAAAGAAMGLASSLSQVFSRRHDDKLEKKIEKIGKELKSLDKSFQDLEDRVNETFGQEKSEAYLKQIDNLRQQNALIQQQIILEDKKKKTDKEAIESYKDTIAENDRQIQKLKVQAEDAIFGQDLQNAISNFADAYAEAWASNTSRAKTAKEQVREMMQEMVRESIRSAVQSSGAMASIRQKMAEFYMDGIFSTAEQEILYGEAEKIQQELDKRFGWADNLFDGSKSFTSNGSTGAFNGMSQDTGNEMNGRLTAIQMGEETLIVQQAQILGLSTQAASILGSILDLDATRNTYLSDIYDRLGSMQLQINAHLENISNNTKNI